MALTPEEVLENLGVELPEVKDDPKYVNWRKSVTNGLIYLSGHMPYVDGALEHVGAVGGEVDEESARASMRVATINALATAAHAVGGLNKLRILHMHAFVASTPEFGNQSYVADAGSELLVEVLGENGRHARTAFGVAALPRRSPVEVELVVEAVA